MNNLTISLKVKYICYCASTLLEDAGRFLNLIVAIRTALAAGDYEPDDLLEISVSPDHLLVIHERLGERKEFQVAAFHAEMKAALFAELNRLKNGDDVDQAASASGVIDVLAERSTVAYNWVQFQIQQGLALILGQA